MKKNLMWSILLITLLLGACTGNIGTEKSDTPQIEVRDAWIRAPGSMMMGGHGSQPTPEASGMPTMEFNGAAYLTLVNSSGSADRLLRATSDIAKVVELHKSEMQGEVMTMKPVEFIEVPANGQLKLEPGGLHIMLIGVSQDLTPGQKANILLYFEKAGEIPVEFEVRAP